MTKGSNNQTSTSHNHLLSFTQLLLLSLSLALLIIKQFMALSLRENRKRKKHLYKSNTHFNSGNHPFEVEDVNFQMLKWLPNILLTLHKTVQRGYLPPPTPLPCMCLCMHTVFTSLVSCHAVFLSWLQFLPVKLHHVRNDFLSDCAQKQRHIVMQPVLHISIWSHCMVNEKHPLSNMIISFGFYVLPFFL